MQLLKDRICGGGPSERLAVGVVVFDELIDALHKLLDAGERAATDGLVGDQGEEALDLIEPGVVGWDEVTLPLFRVVLSPTVTRLFYAVPRTSAARTASG